jgi:hypothetical protein
LRSITRLPSPPKPGRAVAVAVLAGAALAVAGGTTASAVTSSPVTTRAATVTHHPATPHSTTQPLNSEQITGLRAPAPRHTAAKHTAAARRAAEARKAAEARRAAAHRHAAAAKSARHKAPTTWRAIAHAVAGQASGQLPASDRLLPAAVSGAQSNMQLTPTQYANATTIVRQALHMHMGLRSAVIAVATAMQESQLVNINYGTYDSLGLFQQQPDMGWGTAAQVTDPAYASDAFLGALRQYQGNNPGWATQPLWQAAQGVQKSGFPTAYAKWEVQAAQIVASVVRNMY